jgi:hypothetical protein
MNMTSPFQSTAELKLHNILMLDVNMSDCNLPQRLNVIDKLRSGVIANYTSEEQERMCRQASLFGRKRHNESSSRDR